MLIPHAPLINAVGKVILHLIVNRAETITVVIERFAPGMQVKIFAQALIMAEEPGARELIMKLEVSMATVFIFAMQSIKNGSAMTALNAKVLQKTNVTQTTFGQAAIPGIKHTDGV